MALRHHIYFNEKLSSLGQPWQMGENWKTGKSSFYLGKNRSKCLKIWITVLGMVYRDQLNSTVWFMLETILEIFMYTVKTHMSKALIILDVIPMQCGD